MDEKRSIKRRHLIFYLRVFDKKSNELLGYLVDITAEGMMLISEKPIETSKHYELKMDLPSEIGDNKHLIFHADSLWSRKDVNPDFWDTGFKFLDLSAENQDLISNLISFFGFQN